MNEFFPVLRKDHKEVKEILTQLEETENKSKRDELFQKLKEELVPHMKAEEITFYQPLLAKKAARDVALEGLEEHHVSEMVFKELGNMPKDTDQWGAKLSVFKELLEHHIKEEQGETFEAAEKVLSKAQFQSIKKQFLEEKQKFKGNLK